MRIDRAFPYTGCSPLILPRCKYESSCRGEPHFAIERTSQPSDHQPSLPCLACLPTQPPTRLYNRPHAYTCTHRDESTSTDSLFRAFMPLYSARASLGQGGIHRGRKRRGGVPTLAIPLAMYTSRCARITRACDENKCAQGVHLLLPTGLRVRVCGFLCTPACRWHVRRERERERGLVHARCSSFTSRWYGKASICAHT